MNMVQIGRHAARFVGTVEQKLKFEAVWADQIATQLPQLSASMEIDASNPHSAYYKYHLNNLTFDNVWRHEPDPQVRELIKRGWSVQDATVGDDGNALFEAITYSVTGDQGRIDAAVTHHREWLDYRANADANRNTIDYRPECGTTYTCVPLDQIDVVQTMPDESEQTLFTKPGSSGQLRSTGPVPVGLRRPADFLWQKNPNLIVGCGGGNFGSCDPAEAERWQGPGTDFLQAYWMIRYFTEVEGATPAGLTSFPAWPGPRFR
jgi:hypothetical protein